MFDIQSVFFQDVAPVKSVDFVTMIRVSEVAVQELQSVQVDGLPARFMALGVQEILVATPGEQRLQDVGAIRLLYEVNGVSHTELITTFSPEFKPSGAGEQTGRVREDHTIASVGGDGFSSAEDVLVNGSAQKFTIMSNTEILSTIPDGMSVAGFLESTIDVVVSSKTVNRNTFFKYMLGAESGLKTTTGAYKATSQFIKVLMTTPGSDKFDPSGPAGNMQNWISLTTPSARSYGLLAKLTLAVQTTATKFVAQHAQSNVPPEERVSAVEIVNVATSDSLAGSITIAVRIVTFTRQVAVFSVIMNSVKDIAVSAAGLGG